MGRFMLGSVAAIGVIVLGAPYVLRGAAINQAEGATRDRARAEGRLVEAAGLQDGVLRGEKSAIRRLDDVVLGQIPGDSIVRVRLWSKSEEILYSDEPALTAAGRVQRRHAATDRHGTDRRSDRRFASDRRVGPWTRPVAPSLVGATGIRAASQSKRARSRPSSVPQLRRPGAPASHRLSRPLERALVDRSAYGPIRPLPLFLAGAAASRNGNPRIGLRTACLCREPVGGQGASLFATSGHFSAA